MNITPFEGAANIYTNFLFTVCSLIQRFITDTWSAFQSWETMAARTQKKLVSSNRFNETLSYFLRGTDFFIPVKSKAKSILLFWNISHLRINQHNINNIYWSLCKIPVLLSDFNEIWILLADFQKIFKYKIPWTSVQWERWVVPWRQTKRHDEAYSRFLYFFNQLADALWGNNRCLFSYIFGNK
jgi:hypothetical protein